MWDKNGERIVRYAVIEAVSEYLIEVCHLSLSV
jgi:hypothetical protein